MENFSKKLSEMTEEEIENMSKKINCTLTKEYKEHKIFSELEKYSNFYNSLSFSTFSWFTMGIKGIINFDNYIFSSMKGTLESIELILEYGKINDAFSLTRKYYDSVVINVYSLLYLENNHSLENFIVDKINNWVKNEEKLPEYKVMNNYIRNSKQLKSINELIFKGDYYKNMRQRLNDHTHYNYFKYMFYNDSEIADFNNNRVKLLEQLSIDIKNIFILHLIWLFSIKDNYMMAEDYRDYLDMGITPPENSQYWVAPFVQEIFDDIIKKNRPDLVEELKKSTYMQLK
ncbi:hypothetical protein [Aliarcobacter butzleri]|uniref:hypothetical protein n=1 Tax=Aliarcobacter butzleri TaxID=28197 RepID=UPI0018DFF597|nr:hypothetical protein [Aliarcobacter butzleri]